MTRETQSEGTRQTESVDAVVVGAGFAGLYMIHVLRDRLGLQVEAFEAADGVGGTWYWNRYPGARCDIPSHYYSYSFSEELQQEWNWSEKYSAQPEILKYLDYVADKFDLRKNIHFSTRVTAAHYDDNTRRWQIEADDGRYLGARFFIPAVGNLSDANIPVYKGQESFGGEVYLTSRWPAETVDFSGKRVGIIGTGATGMQVVPVVAEEALHLTVFQRTPNYAAPLVNEPMDPEVDRAVKANYAEIRRKAWDSFAGVPFDMLKPSALADTPEQRRAQFETCWREGGFSLWLGSYDDILFDWEANSTVADFVRSKIRERVKDPQIADMLCPPESQPYGTKRQPCETNYYEAFNRDNVTLVDIRNNPVTELYPGGIRTTDGEYPLDALIYATGFDAFTGALFRMDVRGRDGLALKDHWSAGPRTLYGLGTHGFPNMFMITGPQSPSVLFNMPIGIEMHCDWIADCIEYLDRNGYCGIEPGPEGERAWGEETRRIAETTLLPEATSWYMGGNIPGKPRAFMIYLGGGREYRKIISDCAADEYPGFLLEKDDLADAV
jgi:cyclohexanone monooxygenase